MMVPLWTGSWYGPDVSGSRPQVRCVQNAYPVETWTEPNHQAAVFNGQIDDVPIYNRAFSSNEIAAIYNAGRLGKCFTPVAPAITQQPVSQTNLVGTAATFSVTATRTAPLSYQWKFNGTNVTGATNHPLTLNNVQLTNAGNYSVLVTNLAGSTNSPAATLAVNVPASCDAPPTGLVNWWPAEGNANDVIGGNNGSPVGNLGYSLIKTTIGWPDLELAYWPVPAGALFPITQSAV